MRKIKRTSLALLVSPILFVGCMQHEKVSSIIPPKSTDNISKLDLKDKNQTLTIENNDSLKNSVVNKIIDNQAKPVADNTLNSLALYVLNNIDTNIKGNEKVTTQAIEVEDNWEIVNKNIDDEPEPLVDDTLNNLANSVMSNIDTDIKGDKKLTTKPLEVGDNWKVITKEDEILKTAKEFLGVKYVWAANGPSAFDCSGFTKYVFEKHGISLPRYSGYQAKVGKKVAYNRLKKGDLVFFGTAKRGKVNHVGIYIGHHKFIHASSGGKKVMITSFTAKKFYRDRFLHGQRILNRGSLASL